MTKILLGRIKNGAGTFADGEVVYLEKHKWDCDWYWAFGYIGNTNTHFHFDSLLTNKNNLCLATEIFSSTTFTDKQWWVIRDLFKQAYALKDAAEVYQYGGHQTTLAGTTDIIKNKEMADKLNADLKIVLDMVWEYVMKCKEGRDV